VRAEVRKTRRPAVSARR